MATRCYFPTATNYPAAVTPSSWSAGWNKTTGVGTNSALLLHKPGATLVGGTAANAGSGSVGHFTACRRWVSPPLGERANISGTVKGQFQCLEAVATANYTLAVAIKVIQSDGTDRGILLAVSASDNVAATPPEMAVVATNRKLMDASENASITLSSVAAQAQDRIVVELGFRQDSTATSNGQIVIGTDETAADLAENETETGATFNPWIEFSQDIPFFGYAGTASTPTDAAGATGTADPTAVNVDGVLTHLYAGDLLLMIGQQRATGATLAVSQAGGQTWTPLTAIGTTNVTARLFWAIFNGTWSADPSVDFSATTCNTALVHAFRAPANYVWSINQAQVELDIGAAPHTITGQTTTGASPTITVAGWFTADDNTWSTLSGTGWEWIGRDQYRNTSGSDQSCTFAAKTQFAGAATGNVTKTQASLGDDPSTTFILTFEAWPKPPTPTAVLQAVNRAAVM